MKKKEAIEILTEMQKWRRSEAPYHGMCSMPYTPTMYGEAIDVAIERLSK